jgi:DUF438 domain-containing protein
MEEHKVILSNLEKLAKIASEVQRAESYAEIENEIAELRDIAHHLISAENHHKREEEALFPAMERHGVTGPTRAMAAEHVVLRERKQALKNAVEKAGDIDLAEFKKRLDDPASYLTSQLSNHIYKEDKILYQMALQVLTDAEWDQVKKKCDEIGYCCFTPEAAAN